MYIQKDIHEVDWFLCNGSENVYYDSSRTLNIYRTRTPVWRGVGTNTLNEISGYYNIEQETKGD